MIHYAKHLIEQDDVAAVSNALHSDWITCGPRVAEFEHRLEDFCNAPYAVAVSSGTAALHSALAAAGVRAGDEVIVPPITFVATANAVVYQGAVPVFADVEPDTLLIDPASVARRITKKTKAVIAVDYAGQPCNYKALGSLCQEQYLIADCAHSIGALYKDASVPQWVDMACFSFHAAKNMTTCEGGAVVTTDKIRATRVKRFRSHGITTDFHERINADALGYTMESLGFNYRISDMQCALGMSQLAKLPAWNEKRRRLAQRYLDRLSGCKPLVSHEDRLHTYHLFVVRFKSCFERGQVFRHLRCKGIAATLHYPAVHLQPYYKNEFGTDTGLCPVAEEAANCILSLPLHQGMTEDQVDYISNAVNEAVAAYS